MHGADLIGVIGVIRGFLDGRLRRRASGHERRELGLLFLGEAGGDEVVGVGRQALDLRGRQVGSRLTLI
jgi:hypothetical protein